LFQIIIGRGQYIRFIFHNVLFFDMTIKGSITPIFLFFIFKYFLYNLLLPSQKNTTLLSFAVGK